MIDLKTENVQELLADAASHVLEAMFFASVELEPMGDLPQPTLKVDVSFRGEQQGRLEVHLDDAFARTLAGNFTGNFDPSDMTESEVAQVCRELANMLCGATLSRLSPGTIFDLDGPVVTALEPGDAQPLHGEGQWVHTADGSLHLRLYWDHRGAELQG